MRLVELEPAYLKIVDERTFRHVGVTRAEADGLMLWCPKCQGDRAKAHPIICWQPHVPQTWDPKPGRWRIEGAGVDDLSLVAGSSSVLILGGCAAHFFVRDGAIILC